MDEPACIYDCNISGTGRISFNPVAASLKLTHELL
jgi:hypothetical protein